MPSIDVAQFRLQGVRQPDGRYTLRMLDLNEKAVEHPLAAGEMSLAELRKHSVEPVALMEGVVFTEAWQNAAFKLIVEKELVKKLGEFYMKNGVLSAVTAKVLTTRAMNELGGAEQLDTLLNKTITVTVAYAETKVSQFVRKIRQWLAEGGAELLARGVRVFWPVTKRIPFGDMHQGCQAMMLRTLCIGKRKRVDKLTWPGAARWLWHEWGKFRTTIKQAISASIVQEARIRLLAAREVEHRAAQALQEAEKMAPEPNRAQRRAMARQKGASDGSDKVQPNA